VKTGWGSFRPDDSARPGKKVMVLPSNLMTFRQFTFPFQDKKRIKDLIPGELADSLAFSLDDVVWDVSSIHRDRAHAVVVPRGYLKSFVETYGNSVQVIDAEPCALARLARHSGLKDALIIDLGARKTTAVGVKDGKLDMVRVRLIGGDYLDGLVSMELRVDRDRARQAKEEKGLSLAAARSFIDELTVVMGFTSPVDYEKLVITGGGSLLAGLPEYLSEKMGRPVEFFSLPGGLSPHFDCVALGAALYYSVGEEKINLKEKKETANGGSRYTWLLFILLPLILLLFNLKVQEGQLEAENRLLVGAMTRAVKKDFPAIGRVVSPLSQVQSMMKKSGTEGGSRLKALEIMEAIARARRSLSVNFYEMDLADGVMKVRGESDSFQSVDRLKASLDRDFSGAEILEQKTKPGGKVDFYIKLETKKVERKK
jgi:type II secretory pathway component PulL